MVLLTGSRGDPSAVLNVPIQDLLVQMFERDHGPGSIDRSWAVKKIYASLGLFFFAKYYMWVPLYLDNAQLLSSISSPVAVMPELFRSSKVVPSYCLTTSPPPICSFQSRSFDWNWY
jgi:hypothetical protein